MISRISDGLLTALKIIVVNKAQDQPCIQFSYLAPASLPVGNGL